MGVARISHALSVGQVGHAGLPRRQRREPGIPLYSVQEVANVLGVHPETVRRLIHEGRLDGIRVGRLLRIPEDALAALLDAQRVRSEMRR
jgi:excisionase family DNA binding protein